MNDVIGGHTDMMMVSVSLALPPHRDGKVKMLSIGSAKRLPQLPDIPTTAEPATCPALPPAPGSGSAVTAGTPRPIVGQDQRRRTRRCWPRPAFKERFLERQFFETMDSSPEQFRDYHPRRDRRPGRRVIREQNLVIGQH